MRLVVALLFLVPHGALPQARVASAPLAPRGPFAIGTVRSEWIDSSRPEVLDPTHRSRRHVVVQLFYPAKVRAHPVRTAYAPAPDILLGSGAGVSESRRHLLLSFTSHADSGAPPRDSPSVFPVILFSHGLGVEGFAYTSLLEELASHGYIVVLVEHPYSGLTLVSGRVVTTDTDSAWLRPRLIDGALMNGFMSSRIDVQAEDFRFVVHRLKTLAGLHGRVDWTRLVAMGHSFGGTTAVEYCRSDRAPRACVNLDGRLGWSWQVYLEGLRQPFLYLRSDDLAHAESARDSAEIQERIGHERASYSRFTGPVCDQAVRATSHMDFTDRGISHAADSAEFASSATTLRRFEDITLAFLDGFDGSQRVTAMRERPVLHGWTRDCPADAQASSTRP